MISFKSQMFSSPGTRKNLGNNQELGEDATGFIYTHDYAILWIADGSPGRNLKFEGSNFNSRKLAKCMGESFEKVALKDGIPKVPLYDAFFKEFANGLHQKLSELLNGVDDCLRKKKDSVNLDEILEIKMNGEEKTYINIWSTTFIGAIIDMKNKVCYTMALGDCIALVDDESIFSKFKTITGRDNKLFVQWSIKASLEDNSRIEFSKSHPYFETTENIHSIILMSDGVILPNDVENKFANTDLETIWDEIKLINNKTDDDKTALFFNILEQRE